MDQLMIDGSELPVVCMGDEVTVFGQSPALTAQRLAELNDTIAYEIICSVGVRVPRVYLRAGQVMHIEDHLLP
jgi:alanine racemase